MMSRFDDCSSCAYENAGEDKRTSEQCHGDAVQTAPDAHQRTGMLGLKIILYTVDSRFIVVGAPM